MLFFKLIYLNVLFKKLAFLCLIVVSGAPARALLRAASPAAFSVDGRGARVIKLTYPPQHSPKTCIVSKVSR
jgi:hypothetical protein